MGFSIPRLIRIIGEGNRRISKAIRFPENFEQTFLRNASMSNSMNVNGSVTPVAFNFTATRPVLITRFVGIILDNGIQPELFGGLPALTNGVAVGAYNDNNTLQLNLFEGNVKANWEFALLSTQSTELRMGAGAQDLFKFGFNLGDNDIALFLPTNWQLRMTINDDLTGLTQFKASILAYTLRSIDDLDNFL